MFISEVYLICAEFAFLLTK